MLGKLFSNAASSLTPSRGSPSPSRANSSLDSVQEDIYTRNLIFPDADALYAHQHDQVFPMSSTTASMLTSSPTAFDTNPEIDLDARDVRVVVMQEATSTFNSAALMYDSHPHVDAPSCPILSNGLAMRGGRGAAASTTTPTTRRTSIGHAAKPVVITQEAPPRLGAFDRRPSTHARQGSYVETEGQRSSREYREEIATIANCMFGASDVMAYKGTGSKVHILPTEPRSAQLYPFDGHGSLGRSSMRSSRLAQSFTSESAAAAAATGGAHGRQGERKRVLVTRIFPVQLQNDSEDETPSNFDGTSFPFPKPDEKEKEKEKKPKQKRTPMFAIGLVIQLPAAQNTPATPRSARVGSYAEDGSVSSSFNSLRPSWTVLGSGFGVESLDSSFLSDADDRIDVITQHWDIIIRTLDHLQAVASADIVTMLKQVDITSPDPMGQNRGPHHTRTASISVAGKRVEENVKPVKPIRTNVKTVQLMPYALANNHRLRAEIDYARQRIVGGIKSLQVITRQGRWGIWRDEARWVRKWAGGKEQGFFFYNLLTAFLGTHTEWLEAIGPTWYRRRNYKLQRTARDEEMPIKARTVIVANDKMAARRLIFLLSAFLPNNQQQQVPFVRQFRPGTSVSFGGFSQSPPSYVPLNPREESLRRKVNRLKVKTAHPRTMSFPAQAAPLVLANQVIEQHHHRRTSDAPSLLPGALSVPSSYNPARQNSLATTSAATPVPALPHFSTRRPVRGTGPGPRPGSSGSLAAYDLIRSLKRGDTGLSTTSSDSQSRWSVLGSFWGGKRRDSTSLTDTTTTTNPDGTGDAGKSPKTKGKLAEMMEQAQRQRGPGLDRDNDDDDVAAVDSPELTSTTAPKPVAAPPQPIHPSGAYESPVKTSITEDGVIDIDVPLPSLLRGSLPSALSSPSSSGILSSQGIAPELDGFEHYTRSGHDDCGALNVGGWLPYFHPDFVLQALPSPPTDGKPTPSTPTTAQPTLEDQLRASMAAEPTPALPVSALRATDEERWVTVSTALIADTTAFTLKRILLRRLIRLPASAPASAPESAPNSYDGRASIYGNPYHAHTPGVGGVGGGGVAGGAAAGGGGTQSPGVEAAGEVLREEWEEEMCISFDTALIEAVEAIMAHSHSQASPQPTPTPRSQVAKSRSSGASSGRSSRSGSKIRVVVPAPAAVVAGLVGGGREREGEDGDGMGMGTKVPRGEVRTVLLAALEGIAGEVAEARGNADGGGEGESFLREGIRGWLEGVDEGLLG